MTGPVGYWHVDDINERASNDFAAGAEVQHAVRDVGGGKLIATVKDVDGNLMGSFSHRDACRRDDTQRLGAPRTPPVWTPDHAHPRGKEVDAHPRCAPARP